MKALVLVLLLSACASPRYLTEEQDAQMRAVCESDPNGCIAMPASVWLQIERALKGGI
jgi:hypothetical protein